MALYIGVMSGTSMDGVDAALVEIGDHSPNLIASSRSSWPPTLRERLHSVAAGSPLDATALAVLDAQAGACFAEAVQNLLRESTTDASQVAAIGCHGQTVAHAPGGPLPATLQLGDANVIAERTGITTINDFRRRDMAAGGQGAPLAPAFHEAVLRVPDEDRVVLNLGGIANVTILPGDTRLAPLGFDTGPANCLMDAWTRQQLGKPFDEDGAWAASATPDTGLLAALLDDPYFREAPPKSTGTQYFSLPWLRTRLADFGTLAPAQVQATLAALTTQTIAEAVATHARSASRLLVCGGGVRNGFLMGQLAERLGIPVESTLGYGIDPGWMEAMAFAWLAHATLEGRPGNLPSVTGAAGQRILGAIHPA